MSESAGLFFVHKSFIILTWGAHKYSYIRGQFSAFATIYKKGGALGDLGEVLGELGRS